MKINANHQLEDGNIVLLPCPKNKVKFGSGLPDTVVIHYTAGGSADSSAKYLAQNDIKASAHLVIGREGEIFQLVPFDTVSWHAGRSSYGGRNGLNKYSIGIELDNAGVLERVGSEYKSWFGRRYQPNDVVEAVHRNDSKPRFWHTYTQAQLEACRQVCSLLIEKYKINLILGHEEIAPLRKQDPGPAFPLDRFRDSLLLQNRSDDEIALNKDGKVVVDFLNIRANAGVENKKVALPLTRNKKVKVLEEKNGWFKVETTITGWVGKGFIEVK